MLFLCRLLLLRISQLKPRMLFQVHFVGFNKAIIGEKGIVIIQSAIVKQNLQADLQACIYIYRR